MHDQPNAVPRGLIAPVVTPFNERHEPLQHLYIQHAKWLLGNGCTALAPFGTTGEANSLSAAERRRLLEALVDSGVSPDQLVPGTGCCSLAETISLTKHARELGCCAVLMLPPFYYKGVPDEGLYDYFSTVIDRLKDSRLRILLYHIPQISGVGFSLQLIEQLASAFPQIIAGLKDSAGDWTFTASVIERCPSMSVFSGSEVFATKNVRAGGAGCISATGNINPQKIAALLKSSSSPGALEAQQALDAVRQRVQKLPLIAAIKFIVANYTSEPAWRNTRPPLLRLDEQQGSELIDGLEGTLRYRWPSASH